MLKQRHIWRNAKGNPKASIGPGFSLWLRLWSSPFNSLYLGWNKRNWKRQKEQRLGYTVGEPLLELWFARWGFWGRLTMQTWPWQAHPRYKESKR